MNAQKIIDECDKRFSKEEFVSEIRGAEWLAENLNKQGGKK